MARLQLLQVGKYGAIFASAHLQDGGGHAKLPPERWSVQQVRLYGGIG